MHKLTYMIYDETYVQLGKHDILESIYKLVEFSEIGEWFITSQREILRYKYRASN